MDEGKKVRKCAPRLYVCRESALQHRDAPAGPARATMIDLDGVATRGWNVPVRVDRSSGSKSCAARTAGGGR